MAVVTVTGAGNSTVQVNFDSAANAALAQAVAYGISAQVLAGSLTAYNVVGGIAPAGPAEAVISGASPTTFNGSKARVLIDNSTAAVTATNGFGAQTVIAGTGGLNYFATSVAGGGVSATAYVGGGVNQFVNQAGASSRLFLSGTNSVNAQLGQNVTTVLSGITTVTGSNTQRLTVNAGGSGTLAIATVVDGAAGAQINLGGNDSLVATGLAPVLVNIAGSSNQVDLGGLSAGGISTVDLTNGIVQFTNTAAAAMLVNPSGNSAVFNFGNSNLIVAQNSGGSVTLFGGNSGGLAFGGTGGHNLLVGGDRMFGLVGGGDKDTIYGGGGGNELLIASSGNTTLNGSLSRSGNQFYLGQAVTVGGVASVGQDLAIGNGGNNNFIFGSGSAAIAGHGGTGAGTAGYFDFGNRSVVAGATVTIVDFLQSRDKLTLFNGVSANISGQQHVGTTTYVTLSDGLRVGFANVSLVSGTDILGKTS